MPWAVPSGIGHGCNTPCIEITDERTGGVLLLDAGSGIVGVGPGMQEPTEPIALLLTHYHWDHLQGLPFFEPFYRLPGASESNGGVGLGLALVKSITERHGGSVRCEERDGGGACFVIELPGAPG